jgi:neutral trehalase
MAWVGLERYGYLEDAQRLAYRFLYMYVLFFYPIMEFADSIWQG